MPTITFQKATVDDVEIYMNLELKVANTGMYAIHENREEAISEIRDNEVYFMKVDGEIVGFTVYRIKGPDHAFLNGLVIDPKYQGQGLARKAVEWKLEQLKDFKRIDLVTHPHNSKVICMYLSYGFLIEGWKDNYWGDGEPRIVLVREKLRQT